MMQLVWWVDFDDLEELGFKRVYIVDAWAWQVEYEKYKHHKEAITIWEDDRRVQVFNGIEILRTLYDLVDLGYVEKVGDE